MWKMRNLTLEGKIVIFRTLAISKIVFQSMITPVPIHIVNELEKIQKAFLWKNSSPKIKHETLCNDYKGGGLKNIDILNKIISLQCSWIRRLYDNSFHEWKLIPLFLIKKFFNFNFNLFRKLNKLKVFKLQRSNIIKICFINIYFIIYFISKNIFYILYILSLAALLNFIQTYFSREIKLNFFHLSIRKSFCTGKNILPESLKYHLAFCLNIYGTMKISR